MTIEQRIRKIAKGKVRVFITTKKRNKRGFRVRYPLSDGNETAIGIRYFNKPVKTHKQAVVELLTAMRLFNQVEFSIKPE